MARRKNSPQKAAMREI
ncbi:hypothetical protein ROI_02400 [Roseburia intestinalis M50/1]|nr:hypothetical protein ROI_02400 [Roseburia intestinalis M50/1]